MIAQEVRLPLKIALMKERITIALCMLMTTFFAQQMPYNTTKGVIAKGYDVVAYFSNNATEGHTDFKTTFNGVKFHFANKGNLEAFKKNPKRYIPQYGGYCSYAIAKTGRKVAINLETFEIREGKLFLFYNAWGNNTLKRWVKEGSSQLKESADHHWGKIRSKKE